MSITTSAVRAASMLSSANGLPCRRITRARIDSGTTYLCMARPCQSAAPASILAEMARDQRRDLRRVGLGQVVNSAADDVQPGIGQALFEMPAHRHRTDRIGVAPDQQRRRRDALDRQARRGTSRRYPCGCTWERLAII